MAMLPIETIIRLLERHIVWCIVWYKKRRRSALEKTEPKSNPLQTASPVINNYNYNYNGASPQISISTNNDNRDERQLKILEDKSSTETSLPAVVTPVDKTFENIDREIEKALLDKEQLSRPLEVVAVEYALDIVRKLTEPQLDILLASAFVYYVLFSNEHKSIHDILRCLYTNSHHFKRTYPERDFYFLQHIGCGSLEINNFDYKNCCGSTLDTIFQMQHNSGIKYTVTTNYGFMVTKELQDDGCFRYIDMIWKSTLLSYFQPNRIGSYIGLKYYEQKQEVKFNNLVSIFS